MPALLEQPGEEIAAIKFATADSLPAVLPHNRHKPRHALSARLCKSICLVLIVVGVVLRVWQLEHVPGVNGDEAWYGVQAQRFLEEYIDGKSLPDAERVNFRTPTGNVWNPFLMIPRLVLDALFAPSVWSLRLPALISGVLTLLLNWWLCRRAIDRTTAWKTTALLSVFPVTLIYSRLGWDACQSVLFCLPLVYLPGIAQRNALSGTRTAIYFVIALVAALLVHPTNIFLVPLSAALCWPRMSAAAKLDFSLQSRALFAGAAICAAVVLGIMRGAWTGVQLSNLISALLQSAGDVIGLFNGASLYGSISLPTDELPAAQNGLLLLSLPTLALLIWMRISCKTPLFSQPNETTAQRYAALFDGTCLAWLCFLGVAGPGAIQPGYERYGLWIIAPGALLIVLAYSYAARRSSAAPRRIALLAAAQLTLLFAGYWQYYLRRFEMPAAEQSLAHWTYRTDKYDSWAQLREELEKSLTSPAAERPNVILIDAADPQRWWFEWKWRYLSHGSAFQWRGIERAEDLVRYRNKFENSWFLKSQPNNSKENLSIQYLSD